MTRLQRLYSLQRVCKVHNIVVDEINLVGLHSEPLIVRFWLMDDDEAMGVIDIYPSEEVNGKSSTILDIFIREEYRGRWLGKEFAKKIVKTVMKILWEKQIHIIYTKQSPEIPRLVDFFNFKRYNDENFYYLEIKPS